MSRFAIKKGWAIFDRNSMYKGCCKTQTEAESKVKAHRKWSYEGPVHIILEDGAFVDYFFEERDAKEFVERLSRPIRTFADFRKCISRVRGEISP